VRGGRASGRIATVLCGVLVAGTVSVLSAGPAHAAFVTGNAKRAVGYAAARGERAAAAVLDTKTGKFYGAGPYRSKFASESVVKVFIATRLLLTGRMHGATERTAYTMITRSDDASASALYGPAGGDGLVPWIARHYRIRGLGSPPSRPGWWGNTHVTARGLVEFYAKAEADPRVGPWLLNAMRHATTYGSDGTYQYFGIPAAGTTTFAIKQGWGADGDCFCRAVFNSTGYVDHGRYAIAMLTTGGSYGRHSMTTLNGMALRLIPRGHLDSTWHNPVLSLSTAVHQGTTVTFIGYGFDRDWPASPRRIAIYDNGTLLINRRTNRYRPGVDRTFGVTGKHGFKIRFTVPAGQHRFVVQVANVSLGTHGRKAAYSWDVAGAPPTTPPPTTPPPAGSPTAPPTELAVPASSAPTPDPTATPPPSAGGPTP
jgi:hypothetical protein